MKNILKCILIFICISLFACNESQNRYDYEVKMEIEAYQRTKNSIQDISLQISKLYNDSSFYKSDSIKIKTNKLMADIDSVIYNLIKIAKVDEVLYLDIWSNELFDSEIDSLKSSYSVVKILYGKNILNPSTKTLTAHGIKIHLRNYVKFLKEQLNIPNSSNFYYRLNTDDYFYKQAKINLSWEDSFVGLSIVQAISELKKVQLEIKISELQTLEIKKFFFPEK